MSLFDVGFDEIKGKWLVVGVTSEFEKYLNQVILEHHVYSVTLDRENIGIAATDGYKMLSDYIEETRSQNE